jgi:hypothetical protein
MTMETESEEATAQREANVVLAGLNVWGALSDPRLASPERVVLAFMWVSVQQDGRGVIQPRTEAELAERVNMRPHAVRAALSSLRRMGLVRRLYIPEEDRPPVAMFAVKWPTIPDFDEEQP